MVSGALYCDGYDVEVDSVQGVKFQKFCVGLCTRGLGNSQVEMPLRKMNTSTLNLDFWEHTSMGRPQRQHEIVLRIMGFIIATLV